jgi:hypothetical protein
MLGKSIDLPFTGDDVIRFLDAIIGRLRPGSSDKPVPSSETIVGGFRYIAAYGSKAKKI